MCCRVLQLWRRCCLCGILSSCIWVIMRYRLWRSSWILASFFSIMTFPELIIIKLSTTHTHQLLSFTFILLLYYLLPSHAHPSNHPKPSPISSYDHQLPPYHYRYLSYSLPAVSSLSKPINTNNYLSSCMHVINLQLCNLI